MSPPIDLDRLPDLLAAGGAPVALAPAVAAVLGAGGAAELRDDPWRLLAVPGVRPDQADSYARSRLGAQARPDDPRRARALVTWLLQRAARDGHSAVPATVVCRALPAYGFTDAEPALAAVVADGAVTALDSAAPDGGRGLLLALDDWAMAEDEASEGVQRLLATARHLGPPDRVEAVADEVGSGAAGAVRAAAQSGVSVAMPETAAAVPVLVAALRGLADAVGCRLVAVTATIRAARHLQAVTGAPAVTRRELLARAPASGPAGLVVVTEAALLDLAEAAALLDVLGDGTHLVLAGDACGLASPGPGRVLADLAESGTVPANPVSTSLPDGHGSVLAALAAGVRGGTLPYVDPAGREVVIVPARDAGEARHRAVQLVADSIPRAVGIATDDIVVVTPRRGGGAGTDAINAACKLRLNPGPGKFAGFDPGDRVVVASGSFAGAPYGEIGTVVGGTDTSLDLDFSSYLATVPVDAAADLRLGWAVTCRQAMAASWPAVVAVFPGEAAGSLSRDLVLSAVIAARAHLSVVHAAGPVLAHAVARPSGRKRVTQASLLRPSRPRT